MDKPVEQTWGIRFNSEPAYKRVKSVDQLPGCPDWSNPNQINIWQDKGLIVWNNLDQKIECLKGPEILRLLAQLLSDENWKTEGVSITRPVHKISLETTRPGRNKETEPEEKEESPSKTYYQEMTHLPPEAGYKLIDLIQKNEEAIIRTADFEKRQFDQAMKIFWESMLDLSRQKEMDETDLTARNFNWRRTEISRWTCQHQTTTGKVCLCEDKWFWCACAERPGSPTELKKFVKLQEALEWTEKEIVDLASRPETELEPSKPTWEKTMVEHGRLQEKLRNGPFWIDPSLLETKKPTYKIFIELDAEPDTYKTYKSFCSGETFRIDKHYLSPAKLASVLSLPFDHFGFEQILGENSGWHRITSLTTFYQEATVVEQAQYVWNHSQILQQFKSGKITRARYGYEEVETGYIAFLGLCERPENAWAAPESREEYFARKALRESICFSLDVDDYRAFLGLSVKDISDEDLLDGMHTVRSRSKHLPDDAIRESRVWLALHEPIK